MPSVRTYYERSLTASRVPSDSTDSTAIPASDFIRLEIWYVGPVYEPSDTEVKFQVSSLDALSLSTEIECNMCCFCAYIFSVKINIDFESCDCLARYDFACDAFALNISVRAGE